MLKIPSTKNRNKKILINGYFLCRHLTGIERYAHEITKRLDALCRPDEIAIIIPADVVSIPEYKNIQIIRHGETIQHILWQMLTLQKFLIKNKEYIIFEFANTGLPFAPGIVCLHDIYCEFFPEDFNSKKDKVIRVYNKWQYRLIAKKAKHIITVSQFSKNQISKTYCINPDRISVIYSSWNHFRDIKSDYSVFNDFIALEKPFYFSLGSLSKRKNIKWIIEYAVKHPEYMFAISGENLPTAQELELNKTSKISNIILLGYLSDEKVKALMEKCTAFILPSYYEGFGLTPLEALSCGAPVIIANAASLPEIYGKTAHYIDPFDINIDLEELLLEPVESPNEILAKYSYDTAAEQVYSLIQKYTRT